MKRFVFIAASLIFVALALPAAAQNRSAELDRAYEEMRAAYTSYQATLARRDQGIESQGGERTASAAGGSRLNANYFARQAILEQQVEMARQRYEIALKRWNDVK